MRANVSRGQLAKGIQYRLGRKLSAFLELLVWLSQTKCALSQIATPFNFANHLSRGTPLEKRRQKVPDGGSLWIMGE
jgi:hypothetical protein